MLLNILNGSINDKCVVRTTQNPEVIWWMFMSSSTKAAIHLYKNTNVEEIQSLSNITQKLILEHSEEFWMWIRMTVHLPDGQDPYCLMTKWSSGEKQNYVFTQIHYYAWERWMTVKMQLQEGKVKLKNSNVTVLERIAGNRWRTNWIRVEYSPRILVIADSSEDPGWFARAEHQTWSTYRPDHLHDNVQRHRLDKKRQWWNLYFEFRNAKEYAKRFSQGHWTFLGLGDEKKWYGTLPYTLVGKLDSTATQMVEQFKDTGHPVFKNTSALNRGILKKKNARDTIHFNADASNTELLFRIIHSENQLSIFGAVTTWCEQFGLTEEEKGKGKQQESVTKGVSTYVKSQEVKLLVSPPIPACGNS